jgi:hypothetical protein
MASWIIGGPAIKNDLRAILARDLRFVIAVWQAAEFNRYMKRSYAAARTTYGVTMILAMIAMIWVLPAKSRGKHVGMTDRPNECSRFSRSGLRDPDDIASG